MATCLIREPKALTLVRPFAVESYCPSGITHKNNVRAPWIESATIDKCVYVEERKSLLFLASGSPKTFEDVQFENLFYNDLIVEDRGIFFFLFLFPFILLFFLGSSAWFFRISLFTTFAFTHD